MALLQYQIGPCTLDCSIMTLSCGDKTIKLSAKVFELLKLFIDSPDHIVSRQTAIDTIWDGNQAVGEKGFTNSVWLIRKSFKDLHIEDDLLLTLPKLGYQLVLPIKLILAPVEQGVSLSDISNEKAGRTHTVLAVFVLVFVILLGYSAYQFIKSFTQPEAAAALVSPIKSKVTNFEGVEEHIAVSNDGKYLAMQWRNGLQPGKIYIKELNNNDSPLKLISFVDSEEASPAWSPSDQKLAYVRVLASGVCQVRVRHLQNNTDELVTEGCFYLPFKRVLTWSSTDEDTLIFAKQLTDRVALFSYSMATKQSTQLTLPGKNEVDFSPHQLSNKDEFAFIREKSSSLQMSLILKRADNETIDLIANSVSIIDYDFSYQNDSFYVNHIEGSNLVISKIDLLGNVQHTIPFTGLISSVTYSDVTQTLFISEHISKEYIAQLSYQNQKVLRKISSSSRDMYARYSKTTGDILFLSNRSKLWSIWKNNQVNSKNLTRNMGNAGIASVSPISEMFAVNINRDQQQTLYLGNIQSELFESVDIGELAADNLSWSKDGKAIYFKGTKDDRSGIYRYSLGGKLEPIKIGQGNYAVEGESPDVLYMSRFNLNGIWRFDAKNNQSTQITSRLAKYDFGSFFYENGFVYFVERTNQQDKVQRINTTGDVETVMSFPANTIRKFFGLSSADEQSLLLTLKVANEADVASYQF
ncbi:winged helix-turn-helix domain-containing protein [Shewanella sp. UCD-KL21]|uniref:winged helix-turn-helix domain-containing protein n=1 Tax=Shewanella sp. UCD-KL21 TaxID=1917164 RepID=UPI0009704D77|nr:winged helix-turn-helix domain-containing protein [Shewanella sp. UCD-KL21]